METELELGPENGLHGATLTAEFDSVGKGIEMAAQKTSEAAATLHSSHTTFSPVTDAERDQVREQILRILASPAFQNSKRYAAVLRYIVEQTLEGDGEKLKERTIGIEVFNRTPDYDTATDHAVRSAVTEVRKRLGQYYAGAPNELRIEIQPGSYVPQFRWPEDTAVRPEPLRFAAGLPDAAQTETSPPAPRRTLRWIGLAAALAVTAAALIFLTQTARSDDPLDSFWKPILSSSSPVLLCIGNVQGGTATEPYPPELSPTLTLRQFHNSPASTVNVYDAFTLARLSGLLQAHGARIRFASQSDATFTDLQNGPAVLVGLLNNNWTQRLMPKLRFTVEEPTADKVVIVDRNNPSNRDWSVDYSIPYLNITRDYALVLRMVDPKTEQPVVMDAGITVFGTSAAALFLTNPNDIKKLTAIAPPGWEKKNMEIVLATDVIQGRSGPATILAAQFW